MTTDEMKNAVEAAVSLGIKEIPKGWLHLFSMGWIITPASCMCGGSWAWMKPRSSGAKETHGCVCHKTPKLITMPGLVLRPE